MKKLFALLGIFILAAQVSLGQAGALFLCLCQDEFDSHQSSACTPALVQNEIPSCAHDQSQTEQWNEKAAESCQDLLITGADDGILERANQALSPRAPLATVAHQPFLSNKFLLRPAVAIPSVAKYSAPQENATSQYTRTVQLRL